MKKFMLVLLFNLLLTVLFSQNTMSIPDPNKKILIAEVAFGECKLGLKGESCDLALRIDGKSYFIDGTKIDEHGDAHAKDGFCNAISKAQVQGEIEGDRFKVTYFKLIKPKKRKG